MSESVTSQKAALRANARNTLRELPEGEKARASTAICSRLITLPVWKDAQSVLLFAPTASEPDISPLGQTALAAGKLTAWPRFVSIEERYEAAVVEDPAREFIPGKFGIPEPGPLCKVADPMRLDLVLVPGLAFDWHGRRLGRGRGFYDRLLAAVSGKTCGVAFDQQLVSALPVESHDVRLNCILTPSHWLEI